MAEAKTGCGCSEAEATDFSCGCMDACVNWATENLPIKKRDFQTLVVEAAASFRRRHQNHAIDTTEAKAREVLIRRFFDDSFEFITIVVRKVPSTP